MKHIILMILATFTILSCKAQSPILGYRTFKASVPDGAYLKDLNNDLDKFTGTWKYTNGTTELSVIIIKVEQVFNGRYYIDRLKGNYIYMENGVEIINTLSNDLYNDATITGVGLWDNNINKISLEFDDPDKLRATYNLDLTFLSTGTFGVPATMQWNLMQTGFYSSYVPGETPPTTAELDQTMRLPAEVILEKQ